jgi:hypothetical protein
MLGEIRARMASGQLDDAALKRLCVRVGAKDVAALKRFLENDLDHDFKLTKLGLLPVAYGDLRQQLGCGVCVRAGFGSRAVPHHCMPPSPSLLPTRSCAPRAGRAQGGGVSAAQGPGKTR